MANCLRHPFLYRYYFRMRHIQEWHVNMRYRIPKIRSPLKWHGGKSYLARIYIPLFPDFAKFHDPTFGGGSVPLNLATGRREVVAGDMDPNLIRFWRALQVHRGIIYSRLLEIGYIQENFDSFKGIADNWAVEHADEVTYAVSYMIRNRFSRSGLGRDFAKSDRLRGGRMGDENAWITFRDNQFLDVCDTIKDWKFHSRDAIEAIPSEDAYDTLTFIDPPYMHETRTVTKGVYSFDADDKFHHALMPVVRQCAGPVFLCAYQCPLYEDALKGWACIATDMANHSGQGETKERRTETLYVNRYIDESGLAPKSRLVRNYRFS